MKIIKTEKDFDGYWLKNIKTHKGHEGEPLVQASVYKDGKRIGFYSDGDWGGPAQLFEFKPEDEKTLSDHAKKVMVDWKYEYVAGFIYQILNAIDIQKWIKRQSKKKTLFYLKGDKEGEFRTIELPWKGNEKKISDFLNKKYGDKYALVFPRGVYGV